MKLILKVSIRTIWIALFTAVAISVSSQTNHKSDTINTYKTEPEIRDFQISIFPYISINRPSTDDVVNLSFNLFGGYVKEVRVFELGSIVNIDRNNAGTCQIAGVCNLVGGSSTGFQAAGVLNAVRSQEGVQTSGVLNLVEKNAGNCQLAGIGNIVGDSFQGFQGAGIINACKSFRGAQVAGITNLVDSSSGSCQIAGIASLTEGSFDGLQSAGVLSTAGSVNGAQISGVLNATNEITGTQIAGVVNLTHKIKGTQISGVINLTNNVDGLQLSGCLNRTSFFKGVQISTVNIADSCDGIPIGVFSYVGNGYHKIELSADEMLFANAAFKTGVRYFYNIFMVGIHPGNFENPLWTFGYGIGTKFGNQNKTTYDLELSFHHISKGHVREYLSELHRIYFGIEHKFGAKISIAAGISYNLYVTDTDSPQYTETLSSVAPYYISSKSYHNGLNIKTWLGGKIAFRVL